MGSCMFLKTSDKKVKNPVPISEEPNTSSLQKNISDTIDINIPIDMVVDETIDFKKASLRKKDTEFSIDSPIKHTPVNVNTIKKLKK